MLDLMHIWTMRRWRNVAPARFISVAGWIRRLRRTLVSWIKGRLIAFALKPGHSHKTLMHFTMHWSNWDSLPKRKGCLVNLLSKVGLSRVPFLQMLTSPLKLHWSGEVCSEHWKRKNEPQYFSVKARRGMTSQ